MLALAVVFIIVAVLFIYATFFVSSESEDTATRMSAQMQRDKENQDD